MDYNSQLIIGAGEIGKALKNVLSEKYKVDIKDKEPIEVKHYDILHICFPYSEKFIDSVKQYISAFTPELVIIHSTVAPGTTEKCGNICVHSSVRGRHPHLEQGIKTFCKFFGGNNKQLIGEATGLFLTLGIECGQYKDAYTSEIAKLLCTTYYGLVITFQKEVKKLCDKCNVDFFDVYNMYNLTYNDGYKKLKEEQFIRPVLNDMPGGIGGHCVIPNCEILKDTLNFDIAEFILEKNNGYKIEQVQKLAKEKGHCLCNLKLPCPCPAWTNNRRCICAEIK